MDEHIAESEKLNDLAEAYLSEMLGRVGHTGDRSLPFSFTISRGGDLWAKLKALREKSGRPKPREE